MSEIDRNLSQNTETVRPPKVRKDPHGRDVIQEKPPRSSLRNPADWGKASAALMRALDYQPDLKPETVGKFVGLMEREAETAEGFALPEGDEEFINKNRTAYEKSYHRGLQRPGRNDLLAAKEAFQRVMGDFPDEQWDAKELATVRRVLGLPPEDL